MPTLPEPRHAVDRFELDERNARFFCEGKVVDLQPRPFEVLYALARRPGTLITKDALLDEAWDAALLSRKPENVIDVPRMKNEITTKR
jgi:DNA-binding response OmpR family regulator